MQKLMDISLYDFVLYAYLIPMVVTALMSAIDIYIRMKMRKSYYLSRMARHYMFIIFTPIVNLMVCLMTILILIDDGLCSTEEYLRRRFLR